MAGMVGYAMWKYPGDISLVMDKDVTGKAKI